MTVKIALTFLSAKASWISSILDCIEEDINISDSWQFLEKVTLRPILSNFSLARFLFSSESKDRLLAGAMILISSPCFNLFGIIIFFLNCYTVSIAHFDYSHKIDKFSKLLYIILVILRKPTW